VQVPDDGLLGQSLASGDRFVLQLLEFIDQLRYDSAFVQERGREGTGISRNS